MSGHDRSEVRGSLTRRQVVHGALSGGALLTAGGLLAACGGSTSSGSSVATTSQLKSGGSLRVGATGGSAKDTLDAHVPVDDPTNMQNWNLYEPLAVRPADFGPLEMMVAQSIQPEHGKADSWIVKVRPGIEFHNGKTVTAEDVVFSLRRILDPKEPKVGASSIEYVDLKGIKALDKNTVRIPLQYANVTFPDDVGQFFNAIVPVGYDPTKPVGTGPFKYESFSPGQQGVFKKFPNYWQKGKPYVDTLTVISFTDDTARVNALLGGQVDAIDNLPAGLIAQVEGNAALKTLISQTGNWQPFTMRVDQAPFSDVRVRQAMRLLVDRNQMVEQVLAGQGRVANDMYSPFDPGFNSALPQREQDVEKAQSLLKQAGQKDLTVELVTAPVAPGLVQAAEVFAQQAKEAGVNVNLRKTDSGTFYGSNYLNWPFAQDYWATREYLPQVAEGSLPSSPYNETHWADPKFVKLIGEARGELNQAKRNEVLRETAAIEYESGGYIIPYFSNQIDAYSSKLGGFVEAKSGFPLGNFLFKNVGFVA